MLCVVLGFDMLCLGDVNEVVVVWKVVLKDVGIFAVLILLC